MLYLSSYLLYEDIFEYVSYYFADCAPDLYWRTGIGRAVFVCFSTVTKLRYSKRRMVTSTKPKKRRYRRNSDFILYYIVSHFSPFIYITVIETLFFLLLLLFISGFHPGKVNLRRGRFNVELRDNNLTQLANS